MKIRVRGHDVTVGGAEASPALFLHHRGKESRENDSPSWMNLAEAHLLVDIAIQLHTIHGIAPCDIVFLSPYRKQVKKKIDPAAFNRYAVSQ